MLKVNVKSFDDFYSLPLWPPWCSELIFSYKPTIRIAVGKVSVLKFDTPESADQALGTVYSLARQYLIPLPLKDQAVFTWQNGKMKDATQRLRNLAGHGALGDAFWSTLFGSIFFV